MTFPAFHPYSSILKATRKLKKKSETLQKCSASDANNVTIFLFGNKTVWKVKTLPQRNCEFSYYHEYLRNRKRY